MYNEIKNFIIGLVIADATIQGLTGYTATDPRVYEWFPAIDPTIDTTYPAYMVYRVTGYGRGAEFVDRAEKGDLFFHFDIYAIDSEKTSDIAEQLNVLLDLYGHFNTASYRIGQLLVVEDFEMPTEGESSSDRLLRHHVTVRCRSVLKKSPIGTVHYSSASSASSESSSSSST